MVVERRRRPTRSPPGGGESGRRTGGIPQGKGNDRYAPTPTELDAFERKPPAYVEWLKSYVGENGKLSLESDAEPQESRSVTVTKRTLPVRQNR